MGRGYSGAVMLVRGVRLGVLVMGSSSSVSLRLWSRRVPKVDVRARRLGVDVSELDGAVMDGLISVVDSETGWGRWWPLSALAWSLRLARSLWWSPPAAA